MDGGLNIKENIVSDISCYSTSPASRAIATNCDISGNGECRRGVLLMEVGFGYESEIG
jgi:hypothetical protein